MSWGREERLWKAVIILLRSVCDGDGSDDEKRLLSSRPSTRHYISHHQTADEQRPRPIKVHELRPGRKLSNVTSSPRAAGESV